MRVDLHAQQEIDAAPEFIFRMLLLDRIRRSYFSTVYDLRENNICSSPHSMIVSIAVIDLIIYYKQSKTAGRHVFFLNDKCFVSKTNFFIINEL